MGIRMEQTAPGGEPRTTMGERRFHDHLGFIWDALASRPKDAGKVRTFEPAEYARPKPCPPIADQRRLPRDATRSPRYTYADTDRLA